MVATFLTVALALPVQQQDPPAAAAGGEVFIPDLGPDQQPTLEGCVQWFLHNEVQAKVSSITVHHRNH